MSCGNCNTGRGNNNANGIPAGCNNNGSCGTGGGCNKLNVFDWLGNMRLPEDQKPFELIEVRFKNSRKDFFKNLHNSNIFLLDQQSKIHQIFLKIRLALLIVNSLL